ncbi:MAG: hypothetical protein ACSW76_03140 [Bacteroidaceae bacterium]
MKNYFKKLTRSVWVVSALLVLSSCESDVWKDHYSYKSDSSAQISSLAETIESIPGSENFVKALKTTFMYNGDKQLRLTYWDLLNDDQFLTVWLPSKESISDADWAVYTSTAADKDHKKVGTQFIMNHIARFSHPVGTATKEKVNMLSDKSFRSTGDLMGHVGYTKTNIRCTNGILHCLDGTLVYRPSLYEYITGLSQTVPSESGKIYDYQTRLGDWFDKYTLEDVDEKKSVAGDIDDEGVVQYIDKVIIKSSILMKKFGFISVEDSNYALVLPTPAVWDSVYDTVKYYYTYNEIEEARDSMQEFWTNSAMLTDVFFNMNIQNHPKDSVTSTLFRWAERMSEKIPYHVYQKPYAANGLFADRLDSVICSNGIIYIKDFWPFVDSLTFRRPIKIEAENERISGVTTNPRTINYLGGRRFNNLRVMEISKATSAWEADYTIEDNLRGKYLVKLVIFPNTVVAMPNLIHPVVSYTADIKSEILPNGEKKYKRGARWIQLNDTVGRDLTKIDTVVVGPVEFPYSNYNNKPGRVTVTLKSAINNSNEDMFSNKVWLDCIILEPVIE